MTPDGDGDVPWAGLYRRAMKHGISDAAFWRMSPAALVNITSSGRRAGRAHAGNAGTSAAGGGLADCP